MIDTENFDDDIVEILDAGKRAHCLLGEDLENEGVDTGHDRSRVEDLDDLGCTVH